MGDVLPMTEHVFKPYKAKKGEEYMSEGQQAHFTAILNAWKQELMDEVDRTVHHMKDEAANFPDPADRASQEEEFSLELRTRDRALVDAPAARLLRAHVGSRAENESVLRHGCTQGMSARFARIRSERLGKTKVEHFHAPVVGDHDVRGLEISVNDAFLVGRIERLCDLHRQTQCLFCRQWARFDLSFQRLAFDELHRQKLCALVLIEPVNHRDVRGPYRNLCFIYKFRGSILAWRNPWQ